MTQALIFDTETTGKNNPVVIEAAWLKLDSINPFKTSDSFNQRYNPEKPIDFGALATHHILDEELTECPLASSFKLPEDTLYLIGHNIDYDWNVIGQPKVKRICTLALARIVWPSLDSHNQSALLYYLDRTNARDKLKNAHSALADVHICSLILKNICQVLEISNLVDLYQASESARIPKTMPFGKYKGLLFSDIPNDYKKWLLTQDNVNVYLRKSLEN